MSTPAPKVSLRQQITTLDIIYNYGKDGKMHRAGIAMSRSQEDMIRSHVLAAIKTLQFIELHRDAIIAAAIPEMPT